jgi:urease accessory protein
LNIERLRELSAWVHATRETQEMRLQTEQMGRSPLDWLRIQNKADAQALTLCNELRPTYPIAMS